MSEKSAGASSKKRKYFDRGGGGKNKKWRRPKRGAPGVLLTCETGREKKCEREGLEILNYYHCDNVGEDDGDRPSSSSSSSSKEAYDDDDDDGKKKKENNSSLTLEEELKLLKSQGGNLESSAFAEYDTSCRGTVFILCTLPNCDLIPTIQTQYTQSNNNNNNNDNNNNNIKSESENTKSESESTNQCTSKNNSSTNCVSVDNVIVTEEVNQDTICNGPSDEKNIDETSAIASSEVQNKNDNNASSSSSPLPSPWDPISTVRGIMADIDNDTNKAVPRSRFVTRMIPIQATCFASPEELILTTKEVLNKYLSRTTKTFAITFKRRHCTKIDRNTVITIVGDAVIQVVPKCTVNLDNPDATILVEICNNLVGISVIENLKKYRNFNLTEAAAATTSGKNEEKTKKEIK